MRGPTQARNLSDGQREEKGKIPAAYRALSVALWQAHFIIWPLQGNPCCPRCVHLFPSVLPRQFKPARPHLACLPNSSWEVMRLSLSETCWDHPVPAHPPCCLCPSCPLLTARHAGVHPPALHTPGVAAGPLRHLSSRSWVPRANPVTPASQQNSSNPYLALGSCLHLQNGP